MLIWVDKAEWLFDDFRIEGNFEEYSGRLAWSKQQHGVYVSQVDKNKLMFWSQGLWLWNESVLRGGNDSHELSAGGTI